MNHLKQIAARLPEYGLDAMLLNSEPGEYYAVGFHGEGNVVVTAQGCFYFTDSRYIEAANHLITGAEIAMTGRSRNYRAMVQEVVDRCRIRKLGFEEGYLSVADYNLWKVRHLLKGCKHRIPPVLRPLLRPSVLRLVQRVFPGSGRSHGAVLIEQDGLGCGRPHINSNQIFHLALPLSPAAYDSSTWNLL